MGIFSRMGDIINSNLNSMLDKAENPEKIARLIITEMEDTLVEVRSSAARAMADKREMEREIEHYQTQKDDWEAKAELAIEKGREDLARGALTAKRKAEQEVERREAAKEAASTAFAKHQDDLNKLQDKLNEAKAKHRALMMRREAAENRINMRTKIESQKVDDALARYANIERKVDEIEAFADTIDVNGPKHSLADEFAALEAEETIESELANIKARVDERRNKAVSNTPTAPQEVAS